MKTLVFATNNQHKLQEVRQILGEKFDIKGLSDIGCTVDIPETADTLQGNALQKAKYVKEHFGLDCYQVMKVIQAYLLYGFYFYLIF